MLWHGKNFRGIINKAKQMIFDNTGTDLISTNAEDAIKEVNSNLIDMQKHSNGTAVNINSYNSSSNYYNCPSDGYIRVSDTDDTINFWSGATLIKSDGSNDISLFVRKGTNIYATKGGSNATSAIFIPLV